MKGWKIFVHSVRQVFGNLGAALRISAVLYLVQVGVLFSTRANLLGDEEQVETLISQGSFPFASIIIFFVVSSIISLWISVNWHRYILLGEHSGVVPRFHGSRMMGSFGKGLLISVIIALPALVISIAVGAIMALLASSEASASPSNIVVWFGDAVGALVGFLIYVPTLRLSTMLPGAALQSGVSVWSGWTATKGEWGAFALLAVILVVWIVAASGLISLIGTASPLLMIFTAVQGWLSVMIGVSILTTLYGHYIEKRPLL